MILEKLTIENIASIEKAAIDFTASPLADEPVFLICGPTGAGKSVILDAICLALYNTAPRLENGPGESYTDPLSDFDTGLSSGEVKVTDTRMFLRRGAPSCLIELTFRDDNNQRWTASWSCRHARGKVTGKVTKVVWELRGPNSTYLCKRADVEAQIRSLIGLSFEQFRRTSLLAQGEFSRFLTSSADSKAEILEKLTGTAIYSRIGSAIAAGVKERRDKTNLLRIELAATKLLTTEEIERATTELTAADAEQKLLNETLAQLNRQKKQHDEIAALELEITNSETRLQKLSEEAASEKITEMRGNLSLLDLTTPIHAALDMERTLRQSLEREYRSMADTTDWRTASGALIQLHDEIDKAEMSAALFAEEIDRLERLMPLCAEASAAADTAGRRLQIEKQIAALQKAESDSRTQLKLKEEEIAKRQTLTTEAQRKCDALIEREKEARSKFEALDSDNALKKQKEALDRRQLVGEAKTSIEALIAAKRGVAEATSELNKLKAELEETSQLEKQLITDTDTASKRVAQANALYQKQKEATSDYLTELRATLSAGDDCPLCGQRIDRLISTDQFKSLLAPVREQLDEATNAHSALVERLSMARASIKSITGQIKSSTKSHDRLTEEERRASDHCKTNEIASQLTDDIDAACEKLSEMATSAELRVKEATTVMATIEEARKRLDEISKALQKSTADHTALFTELQRLQAQQQSLLSESRQRAERLAELQTDLTAIDTRFAAWGEQAAVTEAGLELHTLINAGRFTEFVDALKKIAQRRSKLEKDIVAVKDKIKEMKSAYDECVNFSKVIASSRPDWVNADPLLPRSLHKPQQTLQLWISLAQKVAAGNSLIESYGKSLADTSAVIETFRTSNPGIDLDKLASIRATAQADMWRSKLSSLDASMTEIRNLLVKKREEVQAKRLLAINLPAEQELSEQIKTASSRLEEQLMRKGALEQQLKADVEARKQHEHTIERKKKMEEELMRWETLNSLYGSSDGKRMRNIAQSLVLEQLVAHANHYLRKLSSRYSLATQPGSLTLLVRDNDAGGDLRPAVNLSGGESFVVSLALALGLPSLSGRVVAMDIVFIDEGFGSLDADIRNVVIDTLERLHSLGGKRVGLISHVETLRERIPVKIEVVRRIQGLSELQIYRS